MEHFDRLADDHEGYTYKWLSDAVDKVTRNRRNRANAQSLSAGTVFGKGGKNQAAPGPLHEQQQQQQQQEQQEEQQRRTAQPRPGQLWDHAQSATP